MNTEINANVQRLSSQSKDLITLSRCTHCGKPVMLGKKYCNFCGKMQAPNNPSTMLNEEANGQEVSQDQDLVTVSKYKGDSNNGIKTFFGILLIILWSLEMGHVSINGITGTAGALLGKYIAATLLLFIPACFLLSKPKNKVEYAEGKSSAIEHGNFSKCIYCGMPIGPRMHYCNYCGKKQVMDPANIDGVKSIGQREKSQMKDRNIDSFSKSEEFEQPILVPTEEHLSLDETNHEEKTDMMYCKHCGKRIESDATYCRYCGKKL